MGVGARPAGDFKTLAVAVWEVQTALQEVGVNYKDNNIIEGKLQGTFNHSGYFLPFACAAHLLVSANEYEVSEGLKGQIDRKVKSLQGLHRWQLSVIAAELAGTTPPPPPGGPVTLSWGDS